MNRKVTLTIDDREITAGEGEKLLWVALDNDIYIPHLCGLREADKPPASCRLCLVEIEGIGRPVTACTQPITDGMAVRTRTPQVDRLVANAFELLLSRHRLNCARCPANRTCELQRIARERRLKLRLTRLPALDHDLSCDDSPATFAYDPAWCVLCGRCVWVCHHRAGVGAIGFVRRGVERKVATFGEVPLAQSCCTQCGECVKACPTGALHWKAADASGPKPG